MKRFLTGLALAATIAGASSAEDHGRLGQTFEIEEPDLLEWIEGRLRAAEASGLIDEMNSRFEARVRERVARPVPVAGIATATEHKSWLYDPAITVQEDIADHNGVVFAQQGQRVNPLETIGLSRRYVFLDGEDHDQVAWALRQREEVGGMISMILVNGAPGELMREHQVRFFYDQGGFLTNRFAITAVPASMRQEGTLVRLTEHGPSEWLGAAQHD